MQSIPWVVAVVAIAAAWLAGPRISDDAYITLRYARSLASGAGFVFNPGERVLGTTTPLFALLLAALHWSTGIGLVKLAFTLAALGHGLVSLVIARLGARAGAAVTGAVAATMYALAPLALRPVLEGMETSLFTCAALLALVPLPRGVPAWQALVAAIAALLRPEGMLVVLLQVLRATLEGWRTLLRTAALIAMALGPWIVFATIYFGNPLPQSMLAKWSYQHSIPPGRAAEYFWYALVATPFSAPLVQINPLGAGHFGDRIAEVLPVALDLATRRLLVLGFGLIVIAIAGRGVWQLKHRCPGVLWPCGFSAAYILAYALANPHVFPWYLTPPLPLLILCVVAGASLGISHRRANTVLAVAALSIATFQAGRLVWMARPGREIAYEHAVAFVGAPLQDPRTRVGALEIGTIGFFSQAQILDHYGLVSPQVLVLGNAAALDRFQPDYYIAQDVYLTFTGVSALPAFKRDYTMIASAPTFGADGPRVQIWKRK